MESPEMYSFSRCINPSYLCWPTNYPVLRRYRNENGNLSKLGRIYRLGTVFAPRQYSYQKTAMGMERPEMNSFSPCKNRSYLCGPSNYPVSRPAVKGRERKRKQIGEDLSPWYRACTKAIFISKGS